MTGITHSRESRSPEKNGEQSVYETKQHLVKIEKSLMFFFEKMMVWGVQKIVDHVIFSSCTIFHSQTWLMLIYG